MPLISTSASNQSHPLTCKERLFAIAAWTSVALAVLLFGLFAPLCFGARRSRRFARMVARALFGVLRCPLSAERIDALPVDAHLLLINHTSFVDPIALSALLPSWPGYAFVARRQTEAQRLLWPVLHSVRTVVLPPHDDAHPGANVELLRRRLAQGQSLIVFPEGGFSSEAGLHPFHSGAVAAACLARVPIATAALRGTRSVLPLGSWMPRRCPIKLVVGPVFSTIGAEADPTSLALAAHDAIMPLTGEAEGTARFTTPKKR